MIKFKRKNLISSEDVSFWSIIWNYICWVLAGKPDGWVVKTTRDYWLEEKEGC